VVRCEVRDSLGGEVARQWWWRADEIAGQNKGNTQWQKNEFQLCHACTRVSLLCSCPHAHRHNISPGATKAALVSSSCAPNEGFKRKPRVWRDGIIKEIYTGKALGSRRSS